MELSMRSMPVRSGLAALVYQVCLRKFRPNAILSVHDCLNHGYFEMAREVC